MYTRGTFLISWALGLAALSGCAGLNERQQAWLTEGEEAYRAKRYNVAVERLSLLIDEVKDRPTAARARYVRGMTYSLAGQRALAYADLEQAARDAKDPDVAWRADAVLGVLCFEDEKWAAAAAALARAADKMPSAPPLDALLYRLGLCQERMGHWAEAQIAYRRIVSSFPGGAYAQNASRRLELNAEHFAIQCGVFSQPRIADSRVAELRQRGLAAYVRPETRQGPGYYVVLVGRYDSYTDAKLALAKVRGYVPSAVLWP